MSQQPNQPDQEQPDQEQPDQGDTGQPDERPHTGTATGNLKTDTGSGPRPE